MGVSTNGDPQNCWFRMKNPIQMDDQEISIYIHIQCFHHGFVGVLARSMAISGTDLLEVSTTAM